MSDESLDIDTSPDVRMEAAQIGWVDKPDFKGNPEKWVDAETFLERGKTVLPILRKTNEKLSSQVDALNRKVSELQAAIVASQESTEALKEFHRDNVKEKVAETRKELLSRIKQAREDGDVEAEVKAGDDMQALREVESRMEEETARPETRRTDPPAIAPWFKEWNDANPWYGTDDEKSGLAQGIAKKLRNERPELRERAFMDEVSRRVESFFQPSRSASRVEGSRGGASGGAGNGRSYADLPADAKAACDRQAQKLVGEGRAFKTIGDWKKYYVASYFGE